MTISLGTPAFTSDWNVCREQNEARRRDPYGFLAYSAIYRLDQTPRRLFGLPGEWATGPEGPTVELGDSEELTIDASAVTGRHTFAVVAEREFRRAARFGDIVIELSERGGVDLVRPIDPAHGLREWYVETPAYSPDPAWVIDAVFEPFDLSRDTAIEAAVEGITHSHRAVGEVVFELGGEEHRLLFLEAPRAGQPGAAFAVFTDSTSGVTTYRASRSLHTVLPVGGGPFALDFNRAGNLQCAYTDFSPCPLAPAQNKLPVPIEAGEKIPVFGTEHVGN
ncbi:DUF1684 domain-containing protein [Subtercola sp. YIM 133946]|uniref:DUF1684 domain-containing protein n=1 Tax=Subtercola sp. YIM 133946 TaxID=3118909 RepID=UPI002F91E048